VEALRVLIIYILTLNVSPRSLLHQLEISGPNISGLIHEVFNHLRTAVPSPGLYTTSSSSIHLRDEIFQTGSPTKTTFLCYLHLLFFGYPFSFTSPEVKTDLVQTIKKWLTQAIRRLLLQTIKPCTTKTCGVVPPPCVVRQEE
jgi:hypothetical protein